MTVEFWEFVDATFNSFVWLEEKKTSTTNNNNSVYRMFGGVS